VPQRDSIHNIVKQAIAKDGWEITDDPYVISYGERFLFVDLGAIEYSSFSQFQGQFIGARREDSRIAIEIKEFRSKSAIADLEQAIGQYVLYQLLLRQVEPEREVYLAIADVVYDEIFSEPIGQLVIQQLPLKLIIVNVEQVEVRQWIPPRVIP
jgi:XisH protein